MKPCWVGKEHGPAAVGRKAIAVEIHEIDVRGSLRDAVLDDACALVDQRINAALDDLLRADAARRDASLAAVLLDDGRDLRIGNRMPRARLVPIPAGAGLLAEPAGFAQIIRRVGEVAPGKLGRP